MSFLGASRSLNVQNLSNNELIDLIKNNEYYSGCCRIIEEKKLEGVDILNLAENRLATWKLPQWLSKKLIYLKETLSKNPESLLQLEEENLNIDSRKNISDTLTTIFKNRQTSKLPPESATDFTYDDDNYLQPQLMRAQKENKFDKPVLKFPNQKGQDLSHIPKRKPIALPRPDLDDEENGYEPPPSHTKKSNKIPSKHPLPLPPDEEIDVYEPPPRFMAKPPEPSEDLHYEYIETEKGDSTGNQRKMSTSKFYVDTDFPPPLPERSILQKKEAIKSLIPAVYMNVDKLQSPSNSHNSERKSSLPRNRKISPSTATLPLSPDTKKSETKKAWSTLTRPLPPLPMTQEHHSSKPKVMKKEVEPEEEAEYQNHAHNKTPEIESLPEYLNTESSNTPSKPNLISELKMRSTQYSKDHLNDLRSHISNVKLKNPHPIKGQSTLDESAKELKEKLEKRRGNTDTSTQSKKELSLMESKMKLPLPPMVLPTNVQNSYFDEVINKKPFTTNNYDDFEDEDDNSEDQPEYLNTTDTNTSTKSTVWRTQQTIPSPVSQFTQEIQMKLKSSTSKKEFRNLPERKWEAEVKQEPSNWDLHSETESDFEADHDEQDDLPEYLNATEAQEPEPKVKKIGPNTPVIASGLASQLAKVQLKSTSRKDINLNDTLADELRTLLQRRKVHNERITDAENITSSYPQMNLLAKPSQKLNSNVGVVENNYAKEDDFEQEDYDVAGSYNDLLNFNNEPFYRNTDRKGAIMLLKDLENGAFLLRPSRKFFLSITIKNKGKYFNLGIEKTSNNKIFSGEGMMRTKEFFSLKSFLEHFEHSPLILQGETGLEEVYLKKVLPPDRY